MALSASVSIVRTGRRRLVSRGHRDVPVPSPTSPSSCCPATPPPNSTDRQIPEPRTERHV